MTRRRRSFLLAQATALCKHAPAACAPCAAECVAVLADVAGRAAAVVAGDGVPPDSFHGAGRRGANLLKVWVEALMRGGGERGAEAIVAALAGGAAAAAGGRAQLLAGLIQSDGLHGAGRPAAVRALAAAVAQCSGAAEEQERLYSAASAAVNHWVAGSADSVGWQLVGVELLLSAAPPASVLGVDVFAGAIARGDDAARLAVTGTLLALASQPSLERSAHALVGHLLGFAHQRCAEDGAARLVEHCQQALPPRSAAWESFASSGLAAHCADEWCAASLRAAMSSLHQAQSIDECVPAVCCVACMHVSAKPSGHAPDLASVLQRPLRTEATVRLLAAVLGACSSTPPALESALALVEHAAPFAGAQLAVSELARQALTRALQRTTELNPAVQQRAFEAAQACFGADVAAMDSTDELAYTQSVVSFLRFTQFERIDDIVPAAGLRRAAESLAAV